MSVKLKISITKEIIMQTRYCRSNDNTGKNCAIAVGIRDIFPRAYVEAEEIYPFGFRGSYLFNSIKLPAKARNFIQKFDYATVQERLKMKPIEFEISIPDKVLEKINISELAPLLQNHLTLELV
jgi:hypothetical protein